MGLFSKLSDGVKSVIPSKKEKNIYDSEFEEETLDGYDAELSTFASTNSVRKTLEDTFGAKPLQNTSQDNESFDETYSFDSDIPSDDDFVSDIPDEKFDFDIQHTEEEENQPVAQPAFPVSQVEASTVSVRSEENSTVSSAPAPKKGGFFSKFRKEKKGNTPVPAAPKPSHTKKKKSHSGVKVFFDIKQVGMVAILFILLGFLGLLLFGGPSKNKVAKNTEKPPVAEEGGAQVASYVNEQDSIFINPFIDSEKLAEMQKNAQPVGNVVTGGNSASLPAIPSSRPDIPAFNPPALPSSMGGGTPAPAPATVQGVMVGNDGNSVAILSDGNVVSAGETYNDNRIAYIGGDGIHFENGNIMEYKN